MKKMTIDGNKAASHIAYAFSEVAAIYPITPSSSMAEHADEWAATGRKNLFGQPLKVAQLQSEAGAAGAVHGSLKAGALTTTYTASQGLLLMIPNMYKISGELLPTVFHVSARAIAAHALSIFGDHQDVMAVRQTGFSMLSSNGVQEAMDMALVSHFATLKSKVPFLHFFDGFRTSHEVTKIDGIEYSDILPLIKELGIDKDIADFKARALNPENPHAAGTAQNPDTYFQNREAANNYYAAVPGVVKEMMAAVTKLTGRKYELYQYAGAKNPTELIVMMGSGADAAEETAEFLNKECGKNVGVLKVRLYRPFSAKDFVDAIPKSVKSIAVLDRTKEPGSHGEPLYLDVLGALMQQGRTDIKVVGGRYGLGSKEFTPTHVHAVFENLWSRTPKNGFTVGIIDDVSGTSLDCANKVDASPKGVRRCKFYGLGGDGTVGANKNAIEIIGDNTDLNVQAYFEYDSKKSGGFTVSHLRFGKDKIKSSYLLDTADFVSCNTPSYVTRYDMVSCLKEGGTFLLNCPWQLSELEAQLPADVKQIIAKNKLKFYTIDALKIAKQAGLKQVNNVMQAAFFKLANIIKYADAVKHIKTLVDETYGRKGEAVLKANYASIDLAEKGLVEIKVPGDWATASSGALEVDNSSDPYYKKFIKPIMAHKGNSMPVSAFDPTGSIPTGTTKFEKRAVAASVPKWIKENCIQCNICSFVCPHATVRPFLLDEAQIKEAPKTLEVLATKPDIKGLSYRIQVSPLDCMGCGACVNACPAKTKALALEPLATKISEVTNWNYCANLKIHDVSDSPYAKALTVKGTQFKQPLMEFSAACAGCGETPYIKLITQMFGDKMVIGNATGCSSIYGGSSPSCPYTKNQDGYGPAWANSLFEDTAEFSYGIKLAYIARTQKLLGDVKAALDAKASGELKTALADWVVNHDDYALSKVAADKIKVLLPNALKTAKGDLKEALATIEASKDALAKKSIWAFGGDGWAYDIGFGGLDHVLSTGIDMNVLVMDTEVYSNTGGQASKATPTGSTAKFAFSGKRAVKKDLGLMMMGYGNVYVAQVAIGDPAMNAHLIKVLDEAHSYPGPSIVIAYSTCLAHGIDMSKGLERCKKAIESGYWALYRYDPRRVDQGLNPFQLDSKDPSGSYREFIEGEKRYTSLQKDAPELANNLFIQAEKESKARIAAYKQKADK